VTRIGWRLGRFGRFSLVGFMGALLQLLLVYLLTKCFGAVSTVATLVAVEATILHNFIWHEHFTWSNRNRKNFRQSALRLWRFHAGNGLVSLVGNTVLMYCLVERLKIPVLPAAVATIVLCALANFLVADRWVFRSNAMDLLGPFLPGDARVAGCVGDGLRHQRRYIPIED
jgi:putative flippase GtrA